MKQLIQTDEDKCNTYKGCGGYGKSKIGKKLR